MGRYSNDYWRPYVPVAERRRQAARKIAKMKKAGVRRRAGGDRGAQDRLDILG